MEYAGKNVKIRKQELTKNIQKKKFKGTEENENKYDALIIALSNAGRVQEIVRCTSDKAYKKKLLLEFGI